MEIVVERYGKGPGESERYRETMCIAADLKSIERALLALPNDGALPKETLLVQSLKGLLQVQSRVSLIGHVLGSDFEESLSTVQFVERCKAEVVISDKSKSVEELGESASDQMARTLRQNNEDYKKEIEQTEKKQAAQLEKLRKVLGLEIDLQAMLKRGPTQSDKTVLENNRQAAQRADNFTKRCSDLNSKLKKTRKEVQLMKQKIEDRMNYFERKISSFDKELNKLTIKCNDLKSEYYNIPSDMSARIDKVRKQITEKKQRELEEKLDILFSSQGVLDQHAQAMTEATRECENAKKAASESYLERMRESKRSQESCVENLARQFQHYLEKERKKTQGFVQDAEVYCNKKKKSKRKLEKELARLSRIVERQKAIIRKAEEGVYTEGIKSVSAEKYKKLQCIPSVQSLALKRQPGVLTSRPATGKGSFKQDAGNSLPKLKRLPSPKANP